MMNQRKKTDKGKPTTTTTSSSATAGATNTTATPTDAEWNEPLERARLAVERNHATMQTLHKQWRTQLLRMAYLVIIVTLHIAQTPSSTCIKDIKQFNRENPEMKVPGSQAIGMILYDSIVEILSMVCAIFIVGCLRRQASKDRGGSGIVMDDFSSLPYRFSCIVIPMIISLYFHKKNLTTTTTSTGGDSCVVQGLLSSLNDNDQKIKIVNFRSEQPVVTRHFPVVLVFHTVVSLSIWFMQYQNRQHSKNIALVEKLQQDLTEAKKAARGDKKKR